MLCVGESTLLVNPYQCDEESDDDDEDDVLNSSAASKSRLQFNRSPDASPSLNRRTSPIPEFSTPKAKQLEAAFNAGTKSSSDSEDQRSFSTSLKTRNFSRKANLSRKGGMTGAGRGRLLKSQERANSRSNSPHSRSTSPSSNTEMGVADREASSAVPSIKVSAFPSRSIVSQAHRNSTPDSENDSPKKRVIRQVPVASSSADSESIQVSTHGDAFALSKDSHSAAVRTRSPQAGKTKPEAREETKAFIEEFKKVKSPPKKPPPVNESKTADEFKKMGGLPRKSLPTDLKNEDEFKKVVKSIAPPPQKPPPVNESKPTDDVFKKVKTSSLPRKSLPADVGNEDEFKKVKSVASPPSKRPPVVEISTKPFDDEFKKVKQSAPPPSKPPPVVERSAKPSENEFKKVKQTSPPSKPPPVIEASKIQEDEFKRVKPTASPSKPPPVIEARKTVDSEFRKVKSSSLERAKKTPEKETATRTLPKDTRLVMGKESDNTGSEFQMGSPKRSPYKAGRSDVKPSLEGLHSSPLKVAVRSGSGDAVAKPTGGDEGKDSPPKSESKPFLPNRRKVLPDLPSSGSPPLVPRGSAPKPSPTVSPSQDTSSVNSSATPPHAPRQLRSLPPSGAAPPPLPEKPGKPSTKASVLSSGSNLGGNLPMLVDAGKQSSITSVGSSVTSEHSAAYDVDSGMASPSSLGSTDSVDTGKQSSFSFDRQKPRDTTSNKSAAVEDTVEADGFPSHGFNRPSSLSRRNASRHNKRPLPRPRMDKEEEEGQSEQSQDQQQQQEEVGPVVTRPRARSRVIRKRPQGSAVESFSPDNTEDPAEGEFQQRRSRTRSSALTAADRARAKAVSSRTESGELGSVSKLKADGENQ